jgi:hypothetical protein
VGGGGGGVNRAGSSNLKLLSLKIFFLQFTEFLKNHVQQLVKMPHNLGNYKRKKSNKDIRNADDTHVSEIGT